MIFFISSLRSKYSRSAAGRDDDIHFFQPVRYWSYGTIVPRTRLARPFARASRTIGHEDLLHARSQQVARRKLRHLSRADQHHSPLLQRSEYLARKFHGCVTDRNSADADIGLGAHSLGDAECARDYRVQQPVDGALILRERVGGLQLAEDLRLADDHRVQACGDSEEMANRIPAFEAVQVLLEPLPVEPLGFG